MCFDAGVPRRLPPYLHHEVTRHGALVWYVRKAKGRRIRIREQYGTAEFEAAYRAALDGREAKPKIRAAISANSMSWLMKQYQMHSDFTSLKPSTRKQRTLIMGIVQRDAGTVPFAEINAASIEASREKRSATPGAAMNFLKTMRGLFKWAVAAKHVTVDPTIGVKAPAGLDTSGHHTWTEAECERFEERWPVGTRERLAFDLLLYTGLRRGDAVRLGRPHLRNGTFFLRAEKTEDDLYIPLLAPLALSIKAAPIGELTYIAAHNRRPMTKESFGNWFRAAARAAGCPGAAHGLRKAGATRAAENGATEKQLMAMFGWRSPEMAAHYTKAADRKHLAQQGSATLLKDQRGNTDGPHLKSGAGIEAES